jgi:L-ascorbate metabolism protein UlaG (beta-lactamase superfamily)
MPTQITWFGHNCWSIETGGRTLLLDPFLDDSPTAPVKSTAVKADFLLVSHGHGDHVGDTVSIAQRTGAKVIANYEVGLWLAKHGVADEKIEYMNPGGTIEQPFGRVKFTSAVHSSSMPDGSYGGVAGGFLLTLGQVKIYFACDTALFLDMKLIGAAGLDLAVLPIGDRYTMGPADSIDAIKLLSPIRVAPCHYNTWPPIAQDAAVWAEQVRRNSAGEPIVLEPGGKIAI